MDRLQHSTTDFDYVDGFPNFQRNQTTTYADGSLSRTTTRYPFDFFTTDDTKPSGMDKESEGLWLLHKGSFMTTPVETVNYHKDNAGANWEVTAEC